MAKPLTQAQKEAVEILERTGGDLNKTGEMLGIRCLSEVAPTKRLKRSVEKIIVGE